MFNIFITMRQTGLIHYYSNVKLSVVKFIHVLQAVKKVHK